MSATLVNTRLRAERLMDERAKLHDLHENVISEANGRVDSTFTESEEELLKGYRERSDAIDFELGQIGEDLEREEKAAQTSKLVRGHIAGKNQPGVEIDDDKIIYRSFSAYARDKLITRIPDIRTQVERQLGTQAVQDAQERLYRAPESTLSSDVGGLLPPQHIAQIMDVIDLARPVVSTGNRVDLATGTLTWPKVTQRPLADKQGDEKTEPNDNQKMVVTMENESADTYISTGDLSWQAINWSTPSALDLYFRLMAEAYALKTEAAACNVLSSAATSIMSPLAGTTSDTFEDWLAAILAGIEQVIDATNATPDTIYLSRDMFFLAAGVTSDTRQMLITPGQLNLRGLSGTLAALNVVTSRGFDTGTAIVGDSRALIVGETAGAPVELRAVEPAIGGLEVGLIGAFVAISFDDDRFADIGPTT